MKKLVFSIVLFYGITTNAQQLLEVLKPSGTGISFVDNFIPDEKCSELVYDRNYGDGKHDFIYCASSIYGSTWITLNLGSEYANVHSPHFNPRAIPTSANDWKAYGSLFQQGRKADGHELTEYEEIELAVTPTVKIFVPKNFTDEQITNDRLDPYNSGDKFYVPRGNEYTNTNLPWWGNVAIEELENLWGTGKTNDPCPVGYHVPTDTELVDMVYPISINPTDYRYIGYVIYYYGDYLGRTFISAPVRDIQGGGGHPYQNYFETALWTSSVANDGSCIETIRDWPRIYGDNCIANKQYKRMFTTSYTQRYPHQWEYSSRYFHGSNGQHSQSMGVAIRCIKDS